MIIKEFTAKFGKDYQLPEMVKERAVRYGETPLLLSEPIKIVKLMNEVFELNRRPQEHVYIVAMNHKMIPCGVLFIGKGSCNSCTVSARDIFYQVLAIGGVCFALVHNHPSGLPAPSAEDITLSDELRRGGELLGIQLVDSIIIGAQSERYYSMKEEGIL